MQEVLASHLPLDALEQIQAHFARVYEQPYLSAVAEAQPMGHLEDHLEDLAGALLLPPNPIRRAPEPGQLGSKATSFAQSCFTVTFLMGGPLAECKDLNENCAMWADRGECKENPKYMVGTRTRAGFCRRSCGVCPAEGPEDPWAGMPLPQRASLNEILRAGKSQSKRTLCATACGASSPLLPDACSSVSVA
jgi:ShK domain-like